MFVIFVMAVAASLLAQTRAGLRVPVVVIQVLLGDGSVRIVSASVDPATWWAAMTPTGGETLGNGW